MRALQRVGARFFLLATAVTLAVGGSSALAARAAQPPLPGVAKTAKATSFRFSFSLAASGGGQLLPGGKPLALRGTGAVDVKRSASQIKINLGALAAALGGATGGAQVPSTVEVIVLKDALYVRFPALAQQVAPGAEWLRLDLSKVPQTTTGGINPRDLGRVSPQALLAALQKAVKVRKLGSGTVRGVPATHYRATVDLAAIVSVLPKADRAEALKALREAGLKQLPVDVWVDGAGYLRRLVLAVKLKAQGSPVSLRLSADLFDFGKPVAVAAPPADKTADASQILEQLLGGLLGSGKTGP